MLEGAESLRCVSNQNLLSAESHCSRLRAGVVAQVCNPSTWETEASLGYTVRPLSEKQKGGRDGSGAQRTCCAEMRAGVWDLSDQVRSLEASTCCDIKGWRLEDCFLAA